jgi:hypothetical protein
MQLRRPLLPIWHIEAPISDSPLLRHMRELLSDGVVRVKSEEPIGCLKRYLLVCSGMLRRARQYQVSYAAFVCNTTQDANFGLRESTTPEITLKYRHKYGVNSNSIDDEQSGGEVSRYAGFEHQGSTEQCRKGL